MAQRQGKKWFGVAPPFDPADGVTVVESPGTGVGYWVGGLSVLYEAESGQFYLFYRVRKPIGQGRGWQCRIARSSDGTRFSTVWSATRGQFNSESIEGGALVMSLDSRLRLYVSYVDLADRRWKIALLEADSPEELDPVSKRVVLTGEDTDSEGVKDPYVAIVGGRYYMFTHYAPRHLIPDDATEEELHGTGNVFATEKGRGSSGLATSNDGISFTWLGEIIAPGEHWDHKLTRVDTMVYVPPVFTVYYSGRSTVQETYEDRTGIAVSFDMAHFHKLTNKAPALSSPYGTGALRYMDAIHVGNEIFYYYECAREDGSHEIRLNKVVIS